MDELMVCWWLREEMTAGRGQLIKAWWLDGEPKEGLLEGRTGIWMMAVWMGDVIRELGREWTDTIMDE